MNIRRHLLLSAVFAAISTYGLSADAEVVQGEIACTTANSNNSIPFCDPSNSASRDIMQNPEIDGAGAITAGAMLAGILALVGERKRRKD